MDTAQKRAKFEKEYPSVLRDIFREIEAENYRYVDALCNDRKYDGKEYLPKYAKEYVITLLCDELVSLTN